MINFYRVAVFFLTLLCWTMIMGSSAIAGSSCRSLFSSTSDMASEESLFYKDFGVGVFVSKVSSTEFHLETLPPPIIAKSAREAQRELRQFAKNNSTDRFTVLFQGFSEAEVLTFKTMLSRDAQFEGDKRLSSVLLETEGKTSSETKGYELHRESAIKARNLMMRRYDWAKATVRLEKNQQRDSLHEDYRLTVEREHFLLKLQLKAVNYLKDRASDIRNLLEEPGLKNANAEDMAHRLISELKKSDEGITNGTLKVMAGDFIVAQHFLE